MNTLFSTVISVLLTASVVLSGFNTVKVFQNSSESEDFGSTVPGGNVKFAEPILVGSSSATSTISGSASSTLPNSIVTKNILATSTNSQIIRITTVASCSEALETDAEGDIICGTDATAAASIDLQDAYNASGADAQITSADAKELVYFISDTTDPADFIISAASQGDLLINIGSTTNAIWQTYGALGIGTTSPGGAFAVDNATTTILAGDLIVDTSVKTGALIATNTLDYRGSATSTWASAGLSVAGGGLASSQGLTITGGQIQSSGKLDITNVATSTFAGGISAVGLASSQGLVLSAGDLLLTTGRITLAGASTSTLPALNVSTALAVLGLTVTGDLNVNTGTSTLQGATFTGLYTTGGIHVDTGDSLFDGKIVVGSGTSTIAGGLSVTGDVNTSGIFISGSTATSSLEGSLNLDGNLITRLTAVGGVASTTSYDINCSNGNTQSVIIDRDVTIKMAGCWGGQTLNLLIDARPAGTGDSQIDWDGPAASTSLMWRAATSTTGYLEQGRINLCSFRFSTGTIGTTVAVSDCSLGYEFR